MSLLFIYFIEYHDCVSKLLSHTVEKSLLSQNATTKWYPCLKQSGQSCKKVGHVWILDYTSVIGRSGGPYAVDHEVLLDTSDQQ